MRALIILSIVATASVATTGCSNHTATAQDTTDLVKQLHRLEQKLETLIELQGSAEQHLTYERAMAACEAERRKQIKIYIDERGLEPGAWPKDFYEYSQKHLPHIEQCFEDAKKEAPFLIRTGFLNC
jgi:hypothetical protein